MENEPVRMKKGTVVPTVLDNGIGRITSKWAQETLRVLDRWIENEWLEFLFKEKYVNFLFHIDELQNLRLTRTVRFHTHLVVEMECEVEESIFPQLRNIILEKWITDRKRLSNFHKGIEKKGEKFVKFRILKLTAYADRLHIHLRVTPADAPELRDPEKS